MKKTYTACFILILSSIFYYGTLIGGGQCTRGRVVYGALANNPASCNVSGCHAGGVVADSAAIAGISDVAFTQGIAAYPTIASDFITIATTVDASGLQYSIYGLDGRSMIVGSLPSYPALTAIDVHALASAHYVVRVSDASHAATFRIIKQ